LHPAVADGSIPSVVAKSTHHHPEDETRALRTRVRKIVGQLQGVERMMEAERDCAEVLAQLVSARKAIKSLSERLIHSHVHHCIESAADDASAKRSLRELLTVLERYVE
jgi:DNA-binding FrmR family transcriptional regulator